MLISGKEEGIVYVWDVEMCSFVDVILCVCIGFGGGGLVWIVDSVVFCYICFFRDGELVMEEFGNGVRIYFYCLGIDIVDDIFEMGEVFFFNVFVI